MNPFVSDIIEEFKGAIAADQLALPVLPEVAVAIREAIRQPSLNAKGLADVILKDAAISGKLMKIAGSSLYRGRVPTRDLEGAISRIGLKGAANLATGLAMQQMFRADNPRMTQSLRARWDLATRVAGMASVFAKHFTQLTPDLASMAGLLHNVGALPIYAFAASHPELQKAPDAVEQLADLMHPPLGERILRHWKFPDGVAQVPRQYADPDLASVDPTYADVVQVAFHQLVRDTNHPFAEWPESRLSAYARLGIHHGDEEVEDLETNIAEATEALYSEAD